MTLRVDIPRVLVVITRSELGGAQRHVHDLVVSLRDRFHFTVLSGEDGWLLQELREQGVVCEVIPALGREIGLWQEFSALMQLVGAIRRYSPSLLHLHSSKAGSLGRIAAMLVRVPVVYTVHGWGFKPGVPFVRRCAVWLVESLLGCAARKVVCVSDYDKALAVRWLPHIRRRLAVVLNGIPSILPSARGRGNAKCPTILMIARFQEPKLQSLLIEAVSKLPNDALCKLVFVGDGPLLDASKNLADRLGIAATFAGAQADVRPYLASASIFVLLSAYEGLPISIIEAMRQSLPVIASKVGGVPELVVEGRTGILVKNELPEVVSAIHRLCTQPDARLQMGDAGRQRFDERFSVEKMAASVEDIYWQAIEN